MKKGILFTCIFLFLSTTYAQVLTGRATNVENEFLENVHVYLLDLQKGAIT
jgi:hypothetical protein